MHQKTICLLGGTGFVGQHLTNKLTRLGCKVRVLTRRRERHRELIINPAVTLFETDIYNADQLRQQFSGIDIVINLVGILNEEDSKGAGFRRAHVELPEKIVAAALDSGVSRLLHMSALNADAGEQHSLYLKTKGEGEDLVHAAAARGLVVTSFRPSVIFGAGDSFFNRFATLLKLARPLLPLACPNSRFAPVSVNDVTEAMCRSLDDATGGERLQLCGPEIYTLQELVTYTRDQLGLCCMIAGLGDGLSRLQASLLGMMPGKPFSLDNYYSLQKDSVCTENALPTLGITPTPIAAVVPGYLANRTTRGQYDTFRRQSRRPRES
jgi:NADH dehydrogenase